MANPLIDWQQRRELGIRALHTALDRGLSTPPTWEIASSRAPQPLRRWGRTDSPFGTITLAASNVGLSHIFWGNSSAEIDAACRDDAWAAREIQQLTHEISHESRRWHVRGTAFQLRVWSALCEIPRGALVTYGDLARALGNPQASRAIGQAVGKNALALAIPCHRVTPNTGEIGGFRWGTTRKQQILTSEWRTPNAEKSP